MLVHQTRKVSNPYLPKDLVVNKSESENQFSKNRKAHEFFVLLLLMFFFFSVRSPLVYHFWFSAGYLAEQELMTKGQRF